MTKSILITGGAGLVGSNLANVASARGHKVSIVDNFQTGRAGYLDGLNIEIFDADILKPDTLTDVFNGHDVVIHLAASGNVIQSIEDPFQNFETNVRGTLNVLQACRDADIKRFLFSSTGGALMGDAEPPVNELSVPSPISPYGASKLACEGYIKAFAKCYGMVFTIFRFGNVLGPNCLHKIGVVNKFYEQVKDGKELHVFGNVSRDFIFIDDLNNAILNTLETTESENETFHLASGVETEIYQIALKVEELIGRNDSKVSVKPQRIGEVERNFADIKKAQERLGLENSKTSIEAVAAVVEYLEGASS